MAPKTHEDKAEKTFGLPMLVASTVDVGRLLREVDAIDEALLQLSLRKSGEEIKMPKTSQLMDKTIELNKLNLLLDADRKQLQHFLLAVKDKAPVLHISFSADPSVAFIEKLMAWLRKEIHPLALVSIGLQPNIGAGCIVRTTNRQFDCSLRQAFANHRDILRDALAAPAADNTPVPAALQPKPQEVPA